MSDTHGTLRIYDIDYFVSPDNYEPIYDGDSSKLVGGSNSTIIDVGYARPGFRVSINILNSGDLITLKNQIKESMESLTPTIVIDTVYPGGKTWYGFFNTQIITSGTMPTNGTFNLPTSINVKPITLTFYSYELERF